MSKKVVISLGGTGGHVYPGIALAESLIEDVEVLFVGGRLSTNKYFSNSGYPFQEVSCSHSLKRFFPILKGGFQSRNILKQFAPNLVVGFGSYYTVPTLLAAKFQGIPFILHEANAILGRVNRVFSPYAAVTGVHFKETIKSCKGMCKHVGMPLRKGFSPGLSLKKRAYDYFDLDPNKRTYLVSGGSQGASAINRIAVEAVPKGDQVIHLTGENTDEYTLRYSERGVLACVRPFEKEMHLAWQIADFSVGRSGAGTIAEIEAFQVPSVFIPFPQSADGHQDLNADLAVQKGLGVKIPEEILTVEALQSAFQFQITTFQEDLPYQSLSELVKEFL